MKRNGWIAASVLFAALCMGIAAIALIASQPRTVVWGADCEEIGARAQFSDGSPAECVEIDLRRIGLGVYGGIWLWPDDYKPEPGQVFECIDPQGPPGATKLCTA